MTTRKTIALTTTENLLKATAWRSYPWLHVPAVSALIPSASMDVLLPKGAQGMFVGWM